MTIRTYTGTLPGVGELLVTAYDERSQVGNEPMSALNDYLNGVS